MQNVLPDFIFDGVRLFGFRINICHHKIYRTMIHFRKFYYRQPGHFAYFLKENKKEEASKVRISLEVEQYFYSKEDVLERLNQVIEGYRQAIVHAIEPLQERLARYEELLK